MLDLLGWRWVSILLWINRPSWLRNANRPRHNGNWLGNRITRQHLGKRRVLELHLHVFHGPDSHLIIISHLLLLGESPPLLQVFIIVLFVLWFGTLAVSLLHVLGVEDIRNALDVLPSKFIWGDKNRVFGLDVVKLSQQDVVYRFLFLFNLFLFSSRINNTSYSFFKLIFNGTLQPFKHIIIFKLHLSPFFALAHISEK